MLGLGFQQQCEAYAFRQLVLHLQRRTDVQNISLMNLAGFCRNCLSKWCPGAASPPLGAIVSCELKQGKYGDWRVASPPGLAVVTQESRFLETGRLFDDVVDLRLA